MVKRKKIKDYLFMESYTADRAKLLDQVSDYFFWLPTSHHQIAVTHK